ADGQAGFGPGGGPGFGNQLAPAAASVATAAGALHGEFVVDELVAANSRRQHSDLDRLTPREREVLSHMAQGWSNARIATTLVLSERAVEKHSNSIFAKLGLTDEPDLNRRVKAVLLYLHAGPA
nr:helix-turn-helix transcriptional regulator [Micromonospora sp. DSM 115978]